MLKTRPKSAETLLPRPTTGEWAQGEMARPPGRQGEGGGDRTTHRAGSGPFTAERGPAAASLGAERRAPERRAPTLSVGWEVLPALRKPAWPLLKKHTYRMPQPFRPKQSPQRKHVPPGNWSTKGHRGSCTTAARPRDDPNSHARVKIRPMKFASATKVNESFL